MIFESRVLNWFVLNRLHRHIQNIRQLASIFSNFAKIVRWVMQVKYYLIIDPSEQSIKLFRLDDHHYVLQSDYDIDLDNACIFTIALVIYWNSEIHI